MLVPGYQATLFPPPPVPNARLRVVDSTGRRGQATASVALAVGQARAVASVDGRTWIVSRGADAVEVRLTDGAFTVTPCGPGWPALCQQILSEHGLERSQP